MADTPVEDSLSQSSDPQQTTETSNEFLVAWRLWHEEVERDRTDPHGFLSVTGMFWLAEEPQRIQGVPGEWMLRDGRAQVLLGPGESLQTGDEITVEGRYVFPRLAPEQGITMSYDDIEIEVAARGDGIIVRPRDPQNPLLATYPGTPAYAPDPNWQIPGRFHPFQEPRRVEHGTVAGYEEFDRSPGEVSFEVEGAPQRVLVYGEAQGPFSLVFRDALAGIETPAANRRLTIAPPAEDGSVVLDFNRTRNFPCAYTDFATCPLPPAQNILTVGIRAGEKLPVEEGPISRA